MKHFLLLGVLVAACCSCSTVSNQTEVTLQKPEEPHPHTDPDQFVGRHRTQVMVLGVFHFDNPGLDSYREVFPFDILEEKRQRELDTVLERIALFQPTKVLLECNRITADSTFNRAYRDYLDGAFDVREKDNEIYQIGFRLAKRLQHDRIYCSDASAPWFGAEMDWDHYDEVAYMQARGQYAKSERYDYEGMYRYHDSLKTVQSLVEHLILVNDRSDRLKAHQAYLTATILEGAGDHYLGADIVGKWYRRNLRIFANAYDVADFDREERLLLLYGSGHVWQLRQLFTDSPDFEYVEVNDYLMD